MRAAHCGKELTQSAAHVAQCGTSIRRCLDDATPTLDPDPDPDPIVETRPGSPPPTHRATPR
jgi:hypothetical protein